MRLTRRALLATAWMPGLALSSHAQTLHEARLKARLAFTLARFTQWPASAFATPADPLTMCLVHHSETLSPAFSELTSQSVGGHPIRVVELAPPLANPACHVLFVHESAERDGAGAMATLASQPVMTIGDSDGFAARGGMVELANVNDAIRLDINLRALRAARLDLSSSVLKLARQVRE